MEALGCAKCEVKLVRSINLQEWGDLWKSPRLIPFVEAKNLIIWWWMIVNFDMEIVEYVSYNFCFWTKCKLDQIGCQFLQEKFVRSAGSHTRLAHTGKIQAVSPNQSSPHVHRATHGLDTRPSAKPCLQWAHPTLSYLP